jgi:hypothetical protein
MHAGMCTSAWDMHVSIPPTHTHSERERERERREEREKCAASSCLKPNKQIIICLILRYSQCLIRAKLCEHKLIGQCTYHCLKCVRQCDKKIETPPWRNGIFSMYGAPKLLTQSVPTECTVLLRLPLTIPQRILTNILTEKIKNDSVGIFPQVSRNCNLSCLSCNGPVMVP